MLNRTQALELVQEYTTNPNLIKHMLAVEAAMQKYAVLLGHEDDQERWGLVGLLHDFDYEKMKEQHPSPWGYEILKEKGFDDEMIQAIEGHAHPDDVSTRPTDMAKALFAVDELTGFIVACALPRPEQISTLTYKSVKKKVKDKAFAAAIDRNHLMQGSAEIGIEFSDHVTNVIEALQNIKTELGLK